MRPFCDVTGLQTSPLQSETLEDGGARSLGKSFKERFVKIFVLNISSILEKNNLAFF